MDTVEITLPISKSVVVIRSYTTRKDDEKSEECLYAGVLSKTNDITGTNIEFPISNVMASESAYVPRLVQSIDGDTSNIKNRIDELRTKDYEAIQVEVERIVEENSPKAKAVKKLSANDTKEK